MRKQQSRVLFCLALACGMSAALASPPARSARDARGDAAASRFDPPHLVGRLEPASIQTPHPYLPDRVAGAWTRVLRDAGATYIRVHFSRFELAEGDWLEIAGPGGSEPHVYTGRGLQGTGSFWAITVPGDLAILTLHAAAGGLEGLEIDAYGRGTEPVFDVREKRVSARSKRGPVESVEGFSSTPGSSEPEPTGLVCGLQDWSDPVCYAANRPVDVYHAHAAVMAIDGCCTETTAFKVSDSGQYLTSYRTSVADLELRLGYQNTECAGRTTTVAGTVVGDEVVSADHVLDYALFSTVGDSSAIPCLQLDRRQPSLGERIYIPQHPWGGPQKVAIWSDLDLGGFCAVDPIPFNNGHLTPPTNEIGYLCDTAEGSLGAPVISGATHRVVGINHVGGCPNTATRMDLIWPLIAGVADGCSIGFACEPLSGDRCNCDGTCSLKEQRFIERGGICADCWEEPSP